MKVVTRYLSILGGSFDTPEEALADEGRLPRIIATYEGDLTKLKAGNNYGAEELTEETAQYWQKTYTDAIATYKAQWAEVQSEQQEPSKTDVLRRMAERHLCRYDLRNPTREEQGTRDKDDPPPRQHCSCDNCHTGRDPLALGIFELLETR